MWTDAKLIPIADGAPYTDADGRQYSGTWPKATIPGLQRVAETPRPDDRACEVTGWRIEMVAGVPTQVWQATARTLAEVQAAALTRIDVAAESHRLRHITPGAGQALAYNAKEAEARAAVADPAPDPAAYPHLAAEVGITAATLAEVAAVVVATADAWRAYSAAIEAARLGAKVQIRAAITPEAVLAAEAAVVWP